MANENKNDLSFMNPNMNKDIASKLQNSISDIYKNTYYSDNKTSSYIDNIRRRMDNDINTLIDKSRIGNNGLNISNLYAKTLASTDDGIIKELKSALQDETMLTDIMDMYSQNAVVRDLDKEIDVVCKYMPKLEEALEIKIDHILSADHFNKDAIELTIATSNDKETTSNPDFRYNQNKDLEYFKKKYNLIKKAKEILRKTSKYGEDLIYVVPYSKALKRLINKASSSTGLSETTLNEVSLYSSENNSPTFLSESAISDIINNTSTKLNFVYRESLQESTSYTKDLYDLNEYNYIDSSKLIEESNKPDSGLNSINIEINLSGVIPSMITQASCERRILEETSRLFPAKSVKSDDSFLSNTSYIKNMNSKFKKFAKEGGSLQQPTNLTMDGLTDVENKNKEADKINVAGAVVRELDHTMVRALYIDNDTCLGYWYIECDKSMVQDEQTTFSSTLGGLRPRRATGDKENMAGGKANNDEVLIKIAKQISDKIDANFINANQDLSKEIYSILKYNADHGHGGKVGRIRVSFIPPEDIVHCYFDMNEKTHRGKSDLSKSLFPAKLFSCLYISNVIALLTRGYDKRVFHVRQSVDTNIQRVLMNVINQVRQSNFNLRQIENLNNILNVTGRFNDLVIPQNANGETPVSFEVLPGQNIEIKTEFMNMLEEMAVNLTGVYIEMVNSRRDEQTATHITMTNARFLMKIYNRQSQYQTILSELFTKIYQAEYNTNDIVEVNLPPPVMLNFTNTSQILAAGNELIQNIATMKMGAEQDEQIKAEFVGKLMEFYFDSFLPMDDINRIYDETQIKIESERNKSADAGMGGAPAGGGDMGY